jgi:hypothetical protein
MDMDLKDKRLGSSINDITTGCCGNAPWGFKLLSYTNKAGGKERRLLGGQTSLLNKKKAGGKGQRPLEGFKPLS